MIIYKKKVSPTRHWDTFYEWWWHLDFLNRQPILDKIGYKGSNFIQLSAYPRAVQLQIFDYYIYNEKHDNF